MKFGSSCLILSIFISSILLGNISSIENKFIYSLLSSNQDTTFKDSITLVSGSNISGEKFKSPGKTMLYSGILPGLGQAYMGKWKRGIIYLALEGIGAGIWYQNNIRGEERKKEYKSYASVHWDFARWIDDYYKWEPSVPPNGFSGDQDDWDNIRIGFVNNTNEGCADWPHCYIGIWNHSHSVKFTYDGNIIISSSNELLDNFFEALCGNPSSDAQCSNTIQEVEDNIRLYSVDVIEDHHFYEGIHKYDMFFSGWDDNDNLVVINSGNNDENVTSPHESAYQDIWSDYNQIKTLAKRGGSFMLINRFVSMIDGLFLAKKWNTENEVSLNLDVYPDLSNKSGVGRLKLTMRWK